MQQQKQKKNHKWLLYTVITIVILSNMPPSDFLFMPAYLYRTKDRSFVYQEQPGKGMDYEVMKLQYGDYLQKNQGKKDTTLYRTFTFKPWQFWQWWEMIVRHERWRLPYISTDNRT